MPEKSVFRTMVRRTYEKYVDRFLWLKDEKILVLHVYAYQDVNSAKEDFNNQLGKMTYSVISQSLSNVILVIVQWVHK